jgi:hypothetical protein
MRLTHGRIGPSGYPSSAAQAAARTGSAQAAVAAMARPRPRVRARAVDGTHPQVAAPDQGWRAARHSASGWRRARDRRNHGAGSRQHRLATGAQGGIRPRRLAARHDPWPPRRSRSSRPARRLVGPDTAVAYRAHGPHRLVGAGASRNKCLSGYRRRPPCRARRRLTDVDSNTTACDRRLRVSTPP